MSEISELHINPVNVENAARQVKKETKKVVVKESNLETKRDTSKAVEQSKEKREEVAGKLMKEVVDATNEALKMNRTSLHMKYHEDVNRVSIKIVDDETDEVIKEIPPEESIDMLKKLLEVNGLLIDERG